MHIHFVHYISSLQVNEQSLNMNKTHCMMFFQKKLSHPNMPGKLATRIRVLGKPCKYFHNDCMINLCNAFIYPYLMYCNQI